MKSVVLPPAALLHSNATPLRFRKEATLWKRLGDIFGKDHMSARTQRKREHADGVGDTMLGWQAGKSQEVQ